MSVLEYFMTNQRVFKNDGVHRVKQLMNEADRRIFPVIVENMDFQEWLTNSMRWVKKYVPKEKISDPVARRRKLFWFYVTSIIFDVIFYMALAKLLLYVYRTYFSN